MAMLTPTAWHVEKRVGTLGRNTMGHITLKRADSHQNSSDFSVSQSVPESQLYYILQVMPWVGVPGHSM